MDEERINLDETADVVEISKTNEQNAEKDAEAQEYMDERNAEKKQIDSFRSICRAIVAILAVFSIIGGVFLIDVKTSLGVWVIIVSVLIAALLEKLIDIVCNFFIDVKEIRIQLWKNSQK